MTFRKPQMKDSQVSKVRYGYEQLQSILRKGAGNIFYIRILTFCIMETAFIALAAKCLAHPIILDVSRTSSNLGITHGFTVTSIIWQTLAVIAAEYIVADAFSREWTAQQGSIKAGTADRVSTITSGFIDRIIHLFTRRASGTFKLAFITSVLLLTLTKLAPGTIGASINPINFPIPVQVGTLINYYESVRDDNKELAIRTSNAAMTLHLEQVENSVVGLKFPPNQLVLYPAVNVSNMNGTLEYNSDIVEFHHDCHWKAPRFVHDPIEAQLAATEGQLVVAGGQLDLAEGWVWSAPLAFGGNYTGSSIIPLSATGSLPTEGIGASAFLFIGGNRTFHNNITNSSDIPDNFSVNLGSLPATWVVGGVGVTDAHITLTGLLASVLVCDPQFQISGGRVRLSENGTLEVIDSGRPRIGNFPESAATLIFASSFQRALVKFEPGAILNFVSRLASVMFMSEPLTNWNAYGIPPLGLGTINKNMDKSLISAAKGFINGQRYPIVTNAPANLMTIPATRIQLCLTLTTSEGLLITISVVFVLTVLLLFALCKSAAIKGRHPFNLHGVLLVLQANNSERPSGSSENIGVEGVLDG